MPDLVHDPRWAGGTRGRILVETAEWGDRELISTVLRRAGFATVACPGPAGAGQRCSLAAGNGCQAAVEADVVVHALRSCDARNLEALRALRQQLPDTPVIVEASEHVARQLADDYEGCIVLEAPLSAAAVVTAVEQVLPGDPEV